RLGDGMLHDLFDLAIAREDLFGLGAGVVELVGGFNTFDTRLYGFREIKMFVVDQVVNSRIIADIGKDLFDVPDGAGGQAMVADEIPRVDIVELPGPPFDDLFQLGDTFILPGIDDDDGDAELSF